MLCGNAPADAAAHQSGHADRITPVNLPPAGAEVTVVATHAIGDSEPSDPMIGNPADSTPHLQDPQPPANVAEIGFVVPDCTGGFTRADDDVGRLG